MHNSKHKAFIRHEKIEKNVIKIRFEKASFSFIEFLSLFTTYSKAVSAQSIFELMRFY